MKIGIISDIHARINPLKRALILLKREQVNFVVCAGDLVEKGYDGDAVVRLMKKYKIPCVRGNHDEDVIDNQRWWREQMDEKEVQKILEALRQGENTTQSRLLTDDTLLYLRTLPFSLEYVWEGYKVMIAHASPKSSTAYLLPTMSTDTIAQHVNHLDTDIFICGHTHTPMLRTIGHVTILNPGWVGGGHQGTCALLTLPEFRYEIYHLGTGKKTTLT